LGSVIMELTTRDGRTVLRETRVPKGNFRNPLTLEDVIQKFRKCTDYSARPFRKGQIEGLLDLLCNLENLENVTRITEMLSPRP
jgi:2-methylcitrate dehydratase PrpD